MKIRNLSLIIILAMGANNNTYSQAVTSYVDPFIGSGGHGHVFVGASVPFGAVQAGPNNIFKGWDWCSGYNYGDSLIIGFAQTHLSGTGIGDLGDVLIMPYTGAIKLDKGTDKEHSQGYGSLFSHANEIAKPGYYAVTLDDYNIRAELTTSERVAFHRYQFPPGKQGHVIIDLKEGINDQPTETYIRKLDNYTLEGYRFSKGWAKDQWIFFAIRSSLPLEKFEVYDSNTLLQSDSGKGKIIKGLITFSDAPALLQLKVGISPVSTSNALKNIDSEIPQWDFDEMVKEADKKWTRELSAISINTKSGKDKKIFYTALYHTMINPALFNDHNGDYRGADKKVYPHATFNNYSVFSLWDTYRAANPLLVLLQPERTSDMINSMLAIYDQQGRLPKWHLMGNETFTMVGLSSLQIISEAYLKGIKGFDLRRAYTAIKTTCLSDTLGMKYVKNLMAIPSDKERRSVANGLEYAIGDGSIALMAKQMKKAEDYRYFLKRSANYKRYFDTASKFFRGKLSDGSWTPGLDPLRANNTTYAEGNAWQYLWLVPHDVEGLISLLGGEQKFNQRLDSFFLLETSEDTKGLVDLSGVIGQYAHGNEPSHHIAYLYAYTGQQWKTAEKVRYILREMYNDQPDGIIGNEDCGQMSAWYIFSSLGFYPVFPASGQYIIGSPIFDKATIRLPGNKTFTVQAINGGDENIYVQRIEFNGQNYTRSYIHHDDIIKGGVLKIFMGKTPNTSFAGLKADRPYSITRP